MHTCEPDLFHLLVARVRLLLPEGRCELWAFLVDRNSMVCILHNAAELRVMKLPWFVEEMQPRGR
jgi:hypothetical protein